MSTNQNIFNEQESDIMDKYVLTTKITIEERIKEINK